MFIPNKDGLRVPTCRQEEILGRGVIFKSGFATLSYSEQKFLTFFPKVCPEGDKKVLLQSKGWLGEFSPIGF